MEGLLDGLGAEDFDDDLQDDTAGASQYSMSPLPLHDQPPLPRPFSGFETASGVKLPPPSKAAMQHAMRLVSEVEDDEPEMKRRKLDPSTSLFQTASGSNIPPPSKSALDRVAGIFDEPIPDAPDSSSLFKTASGSRIPPPTKAALDRAAGLFEEPNPKLGDPGPSTSLFQTGSGSKIPPPSKSSLSRVAALFDEPLEPRRPQPSGSMFTTSSGNFVPPPSDAARASVAGLFGDKPSPPRPAQSLFTTSTGKSVPAPSSAAQRAVAHLFAEDDTQVPATLPIPESKPPIPRPFNPPALSRTPLRSTMHNHAEFTPPQPSSSRFKSIDIKTPSRRLGMSSSSTPVSTKKRGFVTPFKVPHGRGGNIIRAPPAQIRTAATPIDDHHQAVFDMTPPRGRSGLRDSFLKPQYYSEADYERFGIPPEVLQITPQNAVEYTFDTDGSPHGIETTLGALHSDGCRLVTKAWIRNHWPLILWKLSGEIQAQPSLYPNLWSIHEVTNQLKYRYEREYGQAQRALVRRIREHDSPASVPMVLCVSRIFSLPPEETSESKEPPPPETCLELTDGWYTINAQIDAPLKRAVEKGKIQVGRKLAMVGVKLASGGEGEDPLEGGNTSCLLLTGNCCSLARWDARLGRQPRPFIASLCSLTVDGGAIALMDVHIDKLFPKAYMSAQKGTSEAPWDELEESRRAAAWKDKRENELSRLNGEASVEIEKAQQIFEALMAQAEGASSGGSSGANDQDLFESIADAPNPMKMVNSLSAPVASRLVRHAQNHYETTINSRRDDIQQDIESLCPTREIRSFRLVRVIDALEGDREPGRRAGMINVWDYDQMPSDLLKEGGRYVISNLIPGRSGDWTLPRLNDTSRREVYLHTRRDTRWYPQQ